MPKTVAVTGKGGCGKTVLACMALRALLDAGQTPILAVDADPNCNFGEVLGVEPQGSVGTLREQVATDSGSVPSGLSKSEFFEYRIREALTEAEGFDLIVMGQPEGPGCYCFANHLLRGVVDHLNDAYRCTVMDCEAGLEHISRRTTRDVDLTVVVSDVSMRGIHTAQTVKDLVASLGSRCGKMVLVINRVQGELPEAIAEAAQQTGIPLAATIAYDDEIAERDALGESLLDVPANNRTLLTIADLLVETGFIE